MPGPSGRTVEIDTVIDLDRRAANATTMAGWHVQGLDLGDRSQLLRALEPAGALFLGCTFADGVGAELRRRGALVFPRVPDTPVDAYRTSLYTPAELYDGLREGYDQTLDARVYAWARQPRHRDLTLAQALHDHAVDDALREHCAGLDLVGVMGGHALRRGTTTYADAARLGRSLAQTHRVATGGGPGAMEAANLGAYLSGGSPADLDEALEWLARAPGFTPSVDPWAGAAFEVLAARPGGARSLGIPTWYYGHEPPNAFATDIAKYFANATREDILLQVCTAGIVFLPGAAGTVQEIFQDACENYYADQGGLAPMVLVGRDHWTRELPAWPLLEQLARDRAMAGAVHLVDTVDEVPALL